jgi:pimeloyl-ACP methyl ester carboxylesterase
MAPIAHGLEDLFQVLEPWQRGSGGAPLTVGRHIADMHQLIESRCGGARPALVGHSWGAMLALAYAAAHPRSVGPLVLIGCGTFDPRARERLHAILEERMDNGLRRSMERLPLDLPDPDERLRVEANLIAPLYSYELVTNDPPLEVDARANDETWRDMLRLQEEGVYPAALAAIDVPVLMLHGAVDPHPGPMIRASLEPYLPQLEYREWELCGHDPWLEKAVRAEFFEVLRAWLVRQLVEGDDR